MWKGLGGSIHFDSEVTQRSIITDGNKYFSLLPELVTAEVISVCICEVC